MSEPRNGVLEMLPEPVFPQKPDLSNLPDEAFLQKNGKRHGTASQICYAMQGCWLFKEALHGFQGVYGNME